MQSARQKKRYSQQKKKHHEHVKAKGGTEGTPPASGNTSEEKDVKEKSSSYKDHQLSTTPPANTNHGNKAVKKPKANPLGSNWDRYEAPPNDTSESSHHMHQENEEQLEQRLLQLLNLPIHHMTTPLHNSDPSLPESNTSTGLLQLNADSSFLSLDTAALAESLSSLPLHQRLDISLDLIELCGTDVQSSTADAAMLATGPLHEVDLSVCAKKRKYTFEFKPRDLPLSNESTEVGFQTQLGIPPSVGNVFERDSTITSLLPPSVSTPKQEVCSQDDGELDKLLEKSLSLQDGVSEDHRTHSLASTTWDTRESLQSTEKAPQQHVNTAELDDMLDELLS